MGSNLAVKKFSRRGSAYYSISNAHQSGSRGMMKSQSVDVISSNAGCTREKHMGDCAWSGTIRAIIEGVR